MITFFKNYYSLKRNLATFKCSYGIFNFITTEPTLDKEIGGGRILRICSSRDVDRYNMAAITAYSEIPKTSKENGRCPFFTYIYLVQFII